MFLMVNNHVIMSFVFPVQYILKRSRDCLLADLRHPRQIELISDELDTMRLDCTLWL